MKPVEKVDGSTPNAPAWGSDPIAGLLRALDFEFIAFTPGASFRGLHDSIVNYLGNTSPRLLLCLHEEHSISIAHGYARVTGKPMAVALHSNVGLMHATMAIFNAWCDRVPIMMLGAVGPMDSVQRRPWVDWIHTARDLGALIRGYTKWDDHPGSVPAAIESVLRAHQIAMTLPRGPVYVCLDATLQEQPLTSAPDISNLARFRPASPADPASEAVVEAAAILTAAKNPVIMIGRVSTDMDDWNRRVQLAERLNARVVTDIKTGASFPTTHPLHPHPPGLLIGVEACAMIREADAIVSLDWVDLGGSLRQACQGSWPTARVIQCSLDQYSHNGWSMDYQALPSADVSFLANPDRLVRKLLDVLGPAAPPRPAPVSRPAAPLAKEDTSASPGRIGIEAMARVVTDGLASHNPSYIRLPLSWPGERCRFVHPLDYIGFDGGGGLASGPGMAVGAALALRGSGRLPVAIVGDGDYVMGVTAIWTAVHYGIPVLIIVANNQSYFNDELHQERVARARQRPVENRWVGLRMNDPPINMAVLAQGQGAVGLGPVTNTADLQTTLADAVDRVRGGATVVIDVHVAPEYSRGISNTLLRKIAGTS
ncbi:MAG: thiamine pyrophosphate-binding protein [Alphaproteobacteria bacterium]|nr:thiamine pyrophosphate-binding protein [Alphaproteobacteria bacterium]